MFSQFPQTKELGKVSESSSLFGYRYVLLLNHMTVCKVIREIYQNVFQQQAKQ
eukprot:m.28296 g.28296  ORF g.28296 m.28296 type:complete len:53 (-) comp7990_c0_seq1:24-182(-)